MPLVPLVFLFLSREKREERETKKRICRNYENSNAHIQSGKENPLVPLNWSSYLGASSGLSSFDLRANIARSSVS
jgi:hypothetical protein